MSEIPFKGEIRRDYFTGTDVIFTVSRDKRPNDYKIKKLTFESAKNCEFEYGKEMLDTTIKMVGNPWKLRLMYNKYPIVNPDSRKYIKKQYFTNHPNYGHSYIIVDTPIHTQKFHEIEDDLLIEWFKLLIEGEDKMYQDKNIKQVLSYKNSGKLSGGSLYHSHTQIMGFTFVLPLIKTELENIKRSKSKCLFEEAIKREKERTLLSDKNAVAIAPYGSRFKAMSIIIPRRHVSYAGELKPEEIVSIIKFIKMILRKNEKILGENSYNILFHELKNNKRFHFHIEILPRLNSLGSIELNEVYVNSILPEDYTKKFKEIN